MKRLFLASSGLEYIKKFVQADPKQVKMLFIPTAGNLDEDVWWIDKDRDVLGKMGFQITELDVVDANKVKFRAALGMADIVYVAGGNTFYLLKQLRDTGFDQLLTDYVENGGLYAGVSAGALIAGVDIGSIASIDEPEKVEGLKSTKGLGFVPIVPIPHCDMHGRTKKIDAIKKRYGTEYELVLLTDDQGIDVAGDKWAVVDSPRNELEHRWFKKNHL